MCKEIIRFSSKTLHVGVGIDVPTPLSSRAPTSASRRRFLALRREVEQTKSRGQTGAVGTVGVCAEKVRQIVPHLVPRSKSGSDSRRPRRAPHSGTLAAFRPGN